MGWTRSDYGVGFWGWTGLDWVGLGSDSGLDRVGFEVGLSDGSKIAI